MTSRPSPRHVSPVPWSGLSFFGPPTNDASSCDVHYPSLTYWFEAAKSDCNLTKLEVLLSPDERQASLVMQRAHKTQRADWSAVRAKVAVQGLLLAWQAQPQHPVWSDPQLTAIRAWLHDRGWTSDLVIDGLIAVFSAQRLGPRICVLGEAACSPEFVGSKVALLHKKLAGSWQLVHWKGRHSCPSVYSWVLQHRLLIHSVGAPRQRLSDEQIALLCEQSDQFIVFESRGGRRMDAVLGRLKTAGKPVELAMPSRKQSETVSLF